MAASQPSGPAVEAPRDQGPRLGLGIACGVESMSPSGWAQMKGDAAFGPRGPVLMLDTMWSGAGVPPNPMLLARNAYHLT
jgi:hypothetical protein